MFIRIVLLLNVITFIAIFPLDFLTGPAYIALKQYGLRELAIGWVLWLALSTLLLPFYFVRKRWHRRQLEEQPKETSLNIDWILVSTWCVVFWVYVVLRTPFIVLLVGLFV